MTYQLRKLCVSADGPYYVNLCERSEFTQAWDHAIAMFQEWGLNIVGCHYDPGDGGAEPVPEAEFFVAAPGIHETYVIHAASEAS